jgi:hypothetical protein
MFNTTHTFVPLQYFNDFLIVHPYNVKNLNSNTNNNNVLKLTKENPNETEEKTIGNNLFSFESIQTNTIKKRYRRKRFLGPIENDERKLDYFSIDHIVLIKKRKNIVCFKI